MDTGNIFTSIWGLLNTPAVIALIAGGVLWALNKLYAGKPAWAEFEGAIISAVKYAEKMIPDNVANKHLAKLNVALQYVEKVYGVAKKKGPSKKMKESLKEGIQIVHERLEEKGGLKGHPGFPPGIQDSQKKGP